MREQAGKSIFGIALSGGAVAAHIESMPCHKQDGKHETFEIHSPGRRRPSQADPIVRELLR